MIKNLILFPKLSLHTVSSQKTQYIVRESYELLLWFVFGAQQPQSYLHLFCKIRRAAIGHLSAAVVKQHDEALPSQAK